MADLTSVYDAQMGFWYSMNTSRADMLTRRYPDRFSFVASNSKGKGYKTMPTKDKTTSSKSNLAGRNHPKNIKSGKVKVSNFADFQGEATHRRFDEMLDETIYMIGLEPMQSESYGDGYKVHFKELPNAKEIYTAACFGTYVVPSLDALYNATDSGALISETSPIKATIEKAGKSYKFV